MTLTQKILQVKDINNYQESTPRRNFDSKTKNSPKSPNLGSQVKAKIQTKSGNEIKKLTYAEETS